MPPTCRLPTKSSAGSPIPPRAPRRRRAAPSRCRRRRHRRRCPTASRHARAGAQRTRAVVGSGRRWRRRSMPQPRDPVGRAAETAPAAVAFARFADLIAFADERRDLPLKDFARARRAARPFRGRQAGDRTGAVGIEGADRRSRAQAHGADRAALDGGGFRRGRPAHRQGAGGGAADRVHCRRAERSGGADRAGAVSRAPRSSRCASPTASMAPPAAVAPIEDDDGPPDMPPYDDELAFGAHRRPDDVDDDF